MKKIAMKKIATIATMMNGAMMSRRTRRTKGCSVGTSFSNNAAAVINSFRGSITDSS